MGVRGVNGQDPAGLFPASLTRGSGPSQRAAEAGRDTAPTARASPEPSEEQVQQVAREVKQPPAVQRAGTRLRVDEASKRVIAQIMDQNNQVMKQIPPEELLKIAARFRELRGKLFDRKV
jgi:flagellar protein FlaG